MSSRDSRAPRAQTRPQGLHPVPAESSAASPDPRDEDRAELARLRAELAETNRGVVALHADLDEAERRRNDFLAMLAHELRNPLAVARLALDDIDREGSREILHRQLGQLTRLVDDLLEASRVVRGKVSLRMEHVELTELVDTLVRDRAAVHTAHAFAWERPASPIDVKGDPARLRQVLTNLLDNAQKYSPEGTTIEVALTERDGQVSLAVRDEGRGLTAEERRRVFDLFVQAERTLAREPGGLGIGLTLVRHLVQQHDGVVFVESEGLDRGSRFVVELPQGGAPVASSAASSPDAEVTLAGTRVLLVEDNDDLRLLLAARLRRHGLEVDEAEDGLAALATLERGAYDVVVADVGLPEVDGFELARRVRARWPSQRLIALTGYGSTEHRRRAADAGFDRHLVKPVELPQLLEAIGRAKT